MASISYEEEMFILGIYNSGVINMIDIVTKTGRSDQTIRDVLKKYGHKVSSKYTKITDEHRRKAKELRAQGLSYREIAIALHIGCSTVKSLINDECAEKPQQEQHDRQLQIPICNELKAVPIEALLMIREAINMLIEANRS